MSTREVAVAGVVLSLDTAASAVNVALARDGIVIDAVSVPAARRHAEVLVPLLAEVLARADVDVGEIAALVACIGPGLFTGLRVGVTTARTMARVLDVPVVGVSSLEALAAPIGPGRVVAALDARRGEVSWAAFEDGTRRGPERVDPPEVVAAALVPPVTLVGDGASLHADVLVRPGVTAVPSSAPEPAAVLELGSAALARGEGGDAAALLPNYLRRPDAEIAWERSSARRSA